MADGARTSGGVHLETFGCRLNAYESDAIARLAADAGVTDAVVINSCAVTNEAVRQARQAVRRLRRSRPDARLIVTGCAAQIDPDAFAAMPEVDLVLGNQEKLDPDRWAALAGETDQPRVQVDDIAAAREVAPHLEDAIGARARAIVQVQNGCGHRCTFCIIPLGRGGARSAPAGAVVDQVKRAVDAGRREVVLTGVDLTSWGQDLPALGGRAPRLGDLVQRILRLVPDLPRLRLSSIDGVEIDDALWASIEDASGDAARLAPHLHLSLQAGHDLILKRMARRHLTADAERVVDRARAARPDLYVGADVIAGFPTETDDMAAATRAHVDRLGVEFLHVFPFSPRDGAPAARMPQVPAAARKARAAALRALGARRLAARLAGEVGRVYDVLMESPTVGRTAAFARVRVAAPQSVGEIVPVRIVGAEADHLIGEKKESAA